MRANLNNPPVSFLQSLKPLVYSGELEAVPLSIPLNYKTGKNGAKGGANKATYCYSYAIHGFPFQLRIKHYM